MLHPSEAADAPPFAISLPQSIYHILAFTSKPLQEAKAYSIPEES